MSTKNDQKTYQISLNGLVQGVGFRPFIYQLATEFKLIGKVSNGTEGVKILLNANENIAKKFLETILTKKPKHAIITNYKIEKIKLQSYHSFSIDESKINDKVSLLLPPDFAICENCIAELNDPKNHRYRYPFISCTSCGPRYSIITELPYDRKNTTMAAFEMCDSCKKEYNEPTNRRFFSQTNSCGNCGPKLAWHEIRDGDPHLQSFENDEILAAIKIALKDGKIIAVKSIGGFLLICDATNQLAISTLRIRKQRPTKPFAILFKDLSQISKNAFLSAKEQEAVHSEEAPIVILNQKSGTEIAPSVNPKLNQIGAMLPASPILQIIAQDFGKPLVATSANISGGTIIYENKNALEHLNTIADYILTNNREIILPQDDSVIKFAPNSQQKIIIRRSRGLKLNIGDNLAQPNVKNRNYLALGASMKSTFTLKTDHSIFTSQYLGDLESFETQENFKKVILHFLTLFRINPNNLSIICDAHEGYFSSQLANDFRQKWATQITKIQHHEAHLAAISGENDSIDFSQNAMAVIWDGTGLGSDGNIWGGEFFINNKRYHFSYFDSILGDKMSTEPRISALCLTIGIRSFEQILKPKFTEQEWNLYNKIIQKNSLKTSSVGRIFDGVASILGLADKQTFEGEAAMLLESLAAAYFQKNGYNFQENYFNNILENIPTSQLFEGILLDILHKKSKEFIAAKFHFSILSCIINLAQQFKIESIAFSGGVFQNAVLVDLITHHLGKDFTIFFHKNLSPNDENISFGQIKNALYKQLN